MEQLVKLHRGFISYLPHVMTPMPFQNQVLVDFVRNKTGKVVLRVYVVNNLVHYEAYDLVKDNFVYESRSLVLE